MKSGLHKPPETTSVLLAKCLEVDILQEKQENIYICNLYFNQVIGDTQTYKARCNKRHTDVSE